MTLWMWLLACGPQAPVAEPVPKRNVRKGSPPKAEGRYRRKRVKDHAMLRELGYLDGVQEGSRPPGVTLHDASKVAPGNNLYVSGKGPEAFLIDPAGEVLHTWKLKYFDALPDAQWDRKKPFPDHWRRALLLEDGSLFVIWGGQGMARIDKDSKLIWAIDAPIHHDLELAEGVLWTLSRRTEPMGPRTNILDQILKIDPETGEILHTIDVRDTIEDGPYASLRHRYPSDGDLFHTNTLEYLDGRAPFAKGHLLVSFRHLDTIGVIDPGAEKLIWTLTGQWAAQHQPTLLQNGNILLFDNFGDQAHSRVLEVDPHSQAIEWQYGHGEGERFFSRILGSVQRLPNGNTLITESNDGHAFEVTPTGERVWSFTVPHTAGQNEEFIASLYELVRLPPDFAFPK